MLIWLEQLLVRYLDVALHFGRMLDRKLQERGLRAWSFYGGLCGGGRNTRARAPPFHSPHLPPTRPSTCGPKIAEVLT